MTAVDVAAECVNQTEGTMFAGTTLSYSTAAYTTSRTSVRR